MPWAWFASNSGLDLAVRVTAETEANANVRSLSSNHDLQEEMIEQGLMKSPKEGALFTKGAARGKKAQKRQGQKNKSKSLMPFRQFVSPNGFQV